MPEANSERLWTYKDYLGWVEDKRWELIEGKAYNMTPAPSWRHQQVVGELFFQIRSALEGHPCKIVASPIDVRLAEPSTADEDAVNVVQPDIAIVCDSSKIDEHGIKGSPDIVIEVLSPGSATHDTIEKRALYERYGIPEYWIVDIENQRVFILILDDGHYSSPETLERTEVLKSVRCTEIHVELDKVFST
jgi:Uma2 family endonuclease